MPHRAGEITYYDELGVGQEATSEEVRDCFRSLARLLHPDQQTDPQLKDVAERQMRKLNRVYAVLSDPDRRRRYDDSLEEVVRAPTIVFRSVPNVNPGRLKLRLAWALAAAVVAGILVWLAAEGSTSPFPISDHDARAQLISGSGASSIDSSRELNQLRSDLSLARVERDAAYRQLNRLRGLSDRTRNMEPPPELPEPAPASPATSTTLTELPVLAKPATLLPDPQPAREQPARSTNVPAKRFGGFWFYTRPPQNQRGKSSTLYPPEFIEATISEQNGVLRGKYRARYQIVDRAIAPDVNFEFTGTEKGLVAVGQWTGPGGSRGEITLKVTGENTMQIDWTASQLGTDQGLVLGTASLTRRID
jgi:curved DNA-binding protein CbpA